jgi:hypothetical protein
MINFKKIDEIPRRITKHTVEEGDFYTVAISSLEKEALFEEDKEVTEKDLVKMVALTLCDDKGGLLKLSLKDLKSLPDALFKDIVKAVSGQMTGQKKS